MNTDLHWYLLHCKTQQQGRAEMHLQNQGFEIYSPMHQVRRVARSRSRSGGGGNPQLQTRSEALFPGYLFIRLGMHSNWAALHSTRGVNKLVSFNGRPHRVEDALLLALKQRCNQAREPAPLFKPGERVVITEGCFRHVEAIVSAVSSDERIIVLMKILQSEQELTFEPALLAKAS